MTYTDNCTGTASVDQSDTNESNELGRAVTLQKAWAQKIKPTSRCLKRVSIKLTKTLNSDGYIEIRRSLTDGDKLPDGDPQSSKNRLGYATIPYSKMDGTAQLIDLNIVIEPEDLTNGVWMVLCLYAYDPGCTPSYCEDVSFIIACGDSANTVDRYRAIKLRNNAWQKVSSGNIFFETYKQTYTIPCTQPSCTMTIV